MLVIIANRLPFSVKREENKLVYLKNSGGLVSGLISLRKKRDFLWIGNITGNFTNEEKREIKEYLRKENCHPVFISPSLNEAAYNGYANRVLWPILHQFPDCSLLGNREKYKLFNEAFAAAVKELQLERATIWIHDYHLFLLPKFLRAEGKYKIGFFLHTVFPPCFPSAYKFLLEHLVEADSVVFHTYEYSSNFQRILSELKIKQPKKIGAIPIGITPSLFQPKITDQMRKLKKKIGNRYIALGVDRVDFIKGIPNRIEALRRIKKNILYIQVGIPSRLGVREYSELSTLLQKNIGNISNLGDLVNDTIDSIYINQSVSFDDLLSLYFIANMCIISSLYDGMNLVALEYSVCSEGILVMSKFAGASSTLPGAVFHNPWCIKDIVQSIEQGISMGKKERRRRIEINRENIEKFDAENWAKENLKFLE